MARHQRPFVGVAAAFAAIAGAFFWATADGDQAAQAADAPATRMMGAPPALPASASLADADREALFDRAKREAPLAQPHDTF